MTTSDSLFARSKLVSPGGVHSPVRAFKGVGGTPRFMTGGAGAFIRDVDGREILDFCMAFGPLILGHGNQKVRDAAVGAIDKGWSLGTCEPYSLALAEFITSRIPWVESIRFVNSGTEAVMSALRVARGATGRDRVLKFDGCYHGHTDAMLIRSGSGLAEAAEPDSAGLNKATVGGTLVVPLNDEAALEAVFAAHGDEIACAIIEPLPANYGLLPQRLEYLQLLQKLCRKHGALLLLDEVISGFRVGFQGCAGLFGIEPDLVTYGKVIGGGFPVGAYGGKRQYMELVAPAGTGLPGWHTERESGGHVRGACHTRAAGGWPTLRAAGIAGCIARAATHRDSRSYRAAPGIRVLAIPRRERSSPAQPGRHETETRDTVWSGVSPAAGCGHLSCAQRFRGGFPLCRAHPGTCGTAGARTTRRAAGVIVSGRLARSACAHG